MNYIGNAGLKNAGLIINQGCSLSFSVIHRNSDGTIVDHSGSSANLVVKKPSGNEKLADFSQYISCGSEEILATIPAEATAKLKPGGEYLWDLIVTTSSGEVIRLVYGPAVVEDTYSLDR